MKSTSKIKFQGSMTSEPIIADADQIRINQVCIFLERSDILLWTMWRCFNKNITYMTVDQNIPIERLTYMVENAGVEVCITSSQYKDTIPGIKKYIIIDSYEDLQKLSPYYGESTEAYMVFTSGTTGKPKGMRIKKESTLSFIKNFSELIPLKAKDRIICSTSANFDIFFVETILAMYIGMDIVVADEGEKRSPKNLAALVENEDVDILQITPSRMQGIIAYDEELKGFHKLKTIMLGGEALPINILKCLQSNTNARIFNLYGPAEATIWATVADLTDAQVVHIGKEIPEYHVYILDKENKIITNVESGQIAIGLPALSDGYMNQPDKTKEKFIHLSENGEYVYLTGDLGMKSGTGDFFFLGRMDRQVKIRGNRIELEEVENALRSINGVRQVYVGKEDTEYGGKLIAFCIAEKDATREMLEEHLKKSVPDYMIPEEFLFVDDFPTNTNGKVSGAELMELYRSGQSSEEAKLNMEYTNEVERYIIEGIWENMEKKTSELITPETKLTDLGINSILYVNIVVAMEEKYGVEFDEEHLIPSELDSIGVLAAYVIKLMNEKEESE